MGEIVLVISGASGSIYGVRLAEILGTDVRLVVTDSGRITMAHECDGLTPEELAKKTGAILENNEDIAAKSASGSAAIDAVVICPCSGTTLGKLAAGIGDNLAIIAAAQPPWQRAIPEQLLHSPAPAQPGQILPSHGQNA